MEVFCKHKWETTEGFWDRDNYVVCKSYPKCQFCSTIWKPETPEPEIVIGFTKPSQRGER